MVRKKSPEQIEKEKADRLKSTVIDPIDAFAKGANSEFTQQHDPDKLSTESQPIVSTIATQSQHDDNITATSKRPPKETHLHVVMHPDIKSALKKLADKERRKMAEMARDLIVNGLRQRGIEL